VPDRAKDAAELRFLMSSLRVMTWNILHHSALQCYSHLTNMHTDWEIFFNRCCCIPYTVYRSTDW